MAATDCDTGPSIDASFLVQSKLSIPVPKQPPSSAKLSICRYRGTVTSYESCRSSSLFYVTWALMFPRPLPRHGQRNFLREKSFNETMFFEGSDPRAMPLVGDKGW